MAQVFFLRGPAEEIQAIRDLVQAANERLRTTESTIEVLPDAMRMSIAAQIEGGE